MAEAGASSTAALAGSPRAISTSASSSSPIDRPGCASSATSVKPAAVSYAAWVRPAINSVVVSASPTVKRSSPGYSVPSARSTNRPTSANRPIRAELSAAALAAHATAMSGASGVASTSVAMSRARVRFPAFIANVADSASSVSRADAPVTRRRMVARNAVARSGSESIQNWLAARGNAQART